MIEQLIAQIPISLSNFLLNFIFIFQTKLIEHDLELLGKRYFY